ncbi:uncharacterized protein LOC129288810 isoform X2 [Prosopis cineraria]|uniref:uncharacterized protein LOC129288810 isoform X2 n=1 Tax=Prosopis cineraria TaxID=364024 RepID=UPI00240EC7DC|nr:uncharacterized protein LOC129288810 isoform X2 [Prosopis cineraria]
MTSSAIVGGLQEPANPADSKTNLNMSLQISSSRKGLLTEEKVEETIPVTKFNGIGKICREWINNPMNIALVLWLTCVAISGGILFLVITGMLDNVLTKKSQRDLWFEVNNQILNALFTLMCLYQHPKRFHHLFLLCRWKPKDISILRKAYCKNGTYKPNERAHLMAVVLLLHVNCFAQYALCGLNLGYKRSERPNVGVAICLSTAIAAPAIAGVYAIFGPLGKEREEAQNNNTTNNGASLSEKSLSSIPRNEGTGGCVHPTLASLPHEDKATQFTTMATYPMWSGPRCKI